MPETGKTLSTPIDRDVLLTLVRHPKGWRFSRWRMLSRGHLPALLPPPAGDAQQRHFYTFEEARLFFTDIYQARARR